MKTLSHLRIGTRSSALALAQSRQISALLERYNPGLVTELVEIQTTGDQITDRNLAEIGGKGLFTKELEDGLLDGSIDIAVHSMKDVPAFLPEGLGIACIPEREDPRDGFISANYKNIAELPEGAVVGTSSTRRASQLLAMRPDVKIVPFRGNVQTRLKKLQDGVADATFLALAGLNRLGIRKSMTKVVQPKQMLPAVAQGALGIEIRLDREEIAAMLRPLHHQDTADCVITERSFLQTLEGSCRTPIAALATLNGDKIHVDCLIASDDGKHIFRAQNHGRRIDGPLIARDLAEKLKAEAGDLVSW